MTMNYEIMECGLRYLGHYNRSVIKVCGASWGIEIPISRIGEFTELFPDINWEDGEFLHKLIGRYVRVTSDDCGKIVSISHITKDIHYLIDKERDAE